MNARNVTLLVSTAASLVVEVILLYNFDPDFFVPFFMATLESQPSQSKLLVGGSKGRMSVWFITKQKI